MANGVYLMISKEYILFKKLYIFNKVIFQPKNDTT